MKVSEIRMYYPVLLTLADKRLPIRLSYAIGRNIDKLHTEYERIEEERRKLCEEFADKDEEGKPVMTRSVIEGQEVSGYQIAEEKQQEFAAQFSELLDTQVELDLMTIEPQVLDLLDSDRYDPLTPGQVHDLAWMIEGA